MCIYQCVFPLSFDIKPCILTYMITEKPLDDDVINKSPNTGPSIMKKRGYEQTNGIDAGMCICIYIKNLVMG